MAEVRTSGQVEGMDVKDATGPETAMPISDLVVSIDYDYDEDAEREYRRGMLTIGFITFIFASMSPAFKIALEGAGEGGPPVLLLNAAVSSVALCGLAFGGQLLEATTPLPRSLLRSRERVEAAARKDLQPEDSAIGGKAAYFGLDTAARAGLELGLWKFLGTTANLYGLSLTTADHGAFLIQLTTLIVPVVQGIMGVPIPKRIVASIGLALSGVYLFTQDPTAACNVGSVAENAQAVTKGDALCVLAACFYATYDLRLFKWGKLIKPRELITGKISTQAALSILLLVTVGREDSIDFLSQVSSSDLGALASVVLWSGLAVNAVAPFLQVGGQQAVGPTRAQTLYASQPLWAAIMSYFFLGEIVGLQGAVGGAAFLGALLLAATAEPPDPNCGELVCEIE